MKASDLPAASYWQRRSATLAARCAAAEAILGQLAEAGTSLDVLALVERAADHLAAYAPLPPVPAPEPEPLPWEEPRVRAVALACRACGTLLLACHVERCGGQCSRCGSMEVGGV